MIETELDNIAYQGDYEGCKVLLVEDDEIMRLSLSDRLQLEGLPVRAAKDLSSARRILKNEIIDLVISDIRLPDGSGISLFEEISHNYPGIPVVLMTAFGDIADAVNLVKSGALDYLTKPFEINDFISKVEHHLSCIEDSNLSLIFSENEDSFKAGSGRLGKSKSMRHIERLVARLSDSESSVLITGESGVGKEVVASLIHHNSLRRDGPMIRVNCAALSPTLVESELFGHEKGAFTGAVKQHIGRFEQAQGGTIFLDEIAEVSPEIQVKLLRVLQEREIERVGGQLPIKLDVRIIAATQVNLQEAMDSNLFRADLYWRLNVIHFEIPPLRERQEDIVYLARLFVSEQSNKIEGTVNGLTEETEQLLQTMTFPGNVRELKNIIERAIAFSTGPWISPNDLMLDQHEDDIESGQTTLKESVEVAEYKAIMNALIENDNKINQAAKTLGISRKNLWEKMKRYEIEK
ncbi:MAG: sigma-54-dependent Fis family transcriptional regulator [Gammaproteobacteria bacterium]|nr:sigma-54-dependent Fis family transcriptional regulator [Gammaproteobacteria bacterium]